MANNNPRLCVCGHTPAEHGDDTTKAEHHHSCTNPDCTCPYYEWDRDQGGFAVTKSSQR